MESSSSNNVVEEYIGDLKEVDERILHNILYGQWAEWGGDIPPKHVLHSLLQNIPEEVVKCSPPEICLDVSTQPLRGLGVFAASPIQVKTSIGPIPGQLMDLDTAAKEGSENAWEILDDNGHIVNILKVEYGQGEESKAWMTFIQTARHQQEQNLETYYVGGDIYYRSIKEIRIGEELLVWYGCHLPQSLGVPYFETTATKKGIPKITGVATVEEEGKKLKCVLCLKGFNSRSNLRSHMRTHTLHKPFSCNVCNRRFSQSSTLRNHTRLHTGEKPYKCSKCRSAYSQLAGLRAHQKSSQHQPKM